MNTAIPPQNPSCTPPGSASAVAAADTAAPAPQPVDLLTPQQLADRLGICRRSLSIWTRHKIVPMIKVGRFCRFDPVQVRDALALYDQSLDAKRAEGIDTSNRPCAWCSVYGALQSLTRSITRDTLRTGSVPSPHAGAAHAAASNQGAKVAPLLQNPTAARS